MNIICFSLGELQTNCYFLIKDNQCLIIDPADSADFILEEVQRRNLKVRGILATHGHFDHILAAGELQLSLEILEQEAFPLYISREDLFLIERVKDTAKHFLNHSPRMLPIKHTSQLSSGDHTIGDFAFEVISTPGHTPGSCCFYFHDDAVIFTGDTLFKDAMGDYSHSYSNKSLLLDSIKKITSLDEGITVYPGHGEEALIQEIIEIL